MNPPLRIKMFGPFYVWRDGEAEGALQELRAHRMAARLLALLILYPNRVLDKSEATALLWGGGYSEDNLNKTIQALCRALGPDGGRVSSVSRAVRFDLTGVDVDLLAFDRAWVRSHMPGAELRRQRAAFLRGALRVAAVSAVMLGLVGSLAVVATIAKNDAKRGAKRY